MIGLLCQKGMMSKYIAAHACHLVSAISYLSLVINDSMKGMRTLELLEG